MLAVLRNLETFARIDGTWYFAQRTLILDWSATRQPTRSPRISEPGKRAPRSVADRPKSTPQVAAFAKQLKSQG